MRLEHIPLIIGAIVALIGLGFIADALMADSASPSKERRRRVRAERSRAGEAIVGVGVLCMAAALLGRDTWRYGTLSVMIGAAVILVGVVLNRTFLKETLFFRGPARRSDPSDTSRAKPAPRQARPANKPTAATPPVVLRGTPPTKAQVPPSTPAPPRPAPPPMRPSMAAATTPTAPARAVEPPAPKPSPPTPQVGKVDRRKTPRGKK